MEGYTHLNVTVQVGARLQAIMLFPCSTHTFLSSVILHSSVVQLLFWFQETKVCRFDLAHFSDIFSQISTLTALFVQPHTMNRISRDICIQVQINKHNYRHENFVALFKSNKEPCLLRSVHGSVKCIPLESFSR